MNILLHYLLIFVNFINFIFKSLFVASSFISGLLNNGIKQYINVNRLNALNAFVLEPMMLSNVKKHGTLLLSV